jgi:hypothetical protein
VIASQAARVARFASAYFASVFAIGFVLGAVRNVWIAPWLGERTAELVEMPLVVAASFFVARALVRRNAAIGIRGAVVGGLAALALLLCAELAVVWFLRGQTLGDYVAARDPLSGSAYALALLLFAVFPVFAVGRRAPLV